MLVFNQKNSHCSRIFCKAPLQIVIYCALMSGCGQALHEKTEQSSLMAYDQILENPTYKGIVPSRLYDENGKLRDESCDAAETSNPGNYLADDAKSRSADWNALTPLLADIAPPSQLKVTLINIRRVKGKPYSRYFSNNTQNHATEGWSATKPLAFAAMASQIRYESKGKVGIDGKTQNTRGGGGFVPIGDLMSIVTGYRSTITPYNSNNIGSWAQNVSGRPHSTKLINTWLGRPNESFSGGYGDYASGLWGEFFSPNGIKHVSELSSAGAGPNTLSTLTRAEFYKRIVLHRELRQLDVAAKRNICDMNSMKSLSLPCVTWEDMKTILYGAPPKTSRYFKDIKVGGMSAGLSSILHRAVTGGKMENLNKRFGGRWRIYTKIGWGLSKGLPDTRWDGFACFPKYDDNGQKTAGGREFALSISLLPSAGLTTAKADILMQRTMTRIVKHLFDGTLK